MCIRLVENTRNLFVGIPNLYWKRKARGGGGGLDWWQCDHCASHQLKFPAHGRIVCSPIGIGVSQCSMVARGVDTIWRAFWGCVFLIARRKEVLVKARTRTSNTIKQLQPPSIPGSVVFLTVSFANTTICVPGPPTGRTAYLGMHGTPKY